MREHPCVRRASFITWFLATFVVSGTGLAQSAKPTGAPKSGASAPATTGPTATPGPTDPNRAGALGSIAGELVRALGPRDGQRLVVASAIAADIDPVKEKIDALSSRVALLVAGALGARAHDRAASLPVARRLARADRELVYVQLEVQKGMLLVTADVYPVVKNGWDRLKPTPAPNAHAFARSPIDAEIRSFFAPISLEKLALHKAKIDETDVLGMGCGDPDGGGTHLFVVSRDRIARGHLIGGRFVALNAERWGALSQRSPTPLREPLASVVVAPRSHPGEIWIRETDHDGVRVDGQLRLLGTLAGLPIPFIDDASCANVLADSATLDPRLDRCTSDQSERAKRDMLNLGVATGKSDRLAGWSGASATGATLPLTLFAREPNGALRVTVAGSPQSLDNVGAEVALGDMNLDGEPEIAFAADRGDDVIKLVSVSSKGIVERGRWPAPEGVRALAFCPPEAGGAPALAAIVGREVWLVR